MMQQLQDNQRGQINTLLIPLIMAVVLLLGAIGFGVWAFMSREDYKNNVDEKVAVAVEIAKKETISEKENEFREREKDPLKDYRSPSQYGGVQLRYPKTWSGYVDESGRGSSPVDGYFHPTTVPGVQSGTAYALRLQVVDRDFASEVRTFDAAIKAGRARSQAYRPAKVDGVVGLRIEGEIASRQQGIMILIPLRDKTIKIFTQSDQFYADFNNIILPNYSFTP